MKVFQIGICICSAVVMLFPKGIALGEASPASISESALASTYPREVISKETLEDGSLTLSTPLAVYGNDEGKSVYLVGAIHIGEKQYYEELNRRLASYDAVLFEMVGGETVQRMRELDKKEKDKTIADEERKELIILKNELVKKREKKGVFLKLLGGQYEKFSSMLGISMQQEGIDYSPAHFVHADMTHEEMNNAQKARGESMVGWVVAQVVKGLVSPAPRSSFPDISSLFDAMKRGDKMLMKRLWIEIMATPQKNELLADTVLLEGRNDKCLEVFDRVVGEKPELKRIGIFYGSAHLPGLHKKLEKRGYQLRAVEWITAWKAAPVPSPAPVE